ncbi:hypothetical protein D3C80_1617840 [compost metagenome]
MLPTTPPTASVPETVPEVKQFSMIPVGLSGPLSPAYPAIIPAPLVDSIVAFTTPKFLHDPISTPNKLA